MGAPRQKHLALIIARELATQLATATFIADAEGELVFYNEAAADILGLGFAEAKTMATDEWRSLYGLEDLQGTPVPLGALPSTIAVAERRAVHTRLHLVGLDRGRREIAVTAVPLFAHPTDVVGVVVFFWEEGDPVGRE